MLGTPPTGAPRPRSAHRAAWSLRLDRIRCDGRGYCAELLPELISLDDWGYPILAPGGVPDGLVEHARRAEAACPLLALRVEENGRRG